MFCTHTTTFSSPLVAGWSLIIRNIQSFDVNKDMNIFESVKYTIPHLALRSRKERNCQTNLRYWHMIVSMAQPIQENW